MLRLTRQSDYAIVLLTHLAAQPQSGRSASELAESLSIPLPMVGKVLKMLARAGILSSQRGVRGGYSLARPAAEINVAAIISALEGPIAMTECAEPQDTVHDCSRETFCSVRGHWQLISRSVATALEGITLEQMARPAGGLEGGLVTLGRPRSASGAVAGAPTAAHIGS